MAGTAAVLLLVLLAGSLVAVSDQPPSLETLADTSGAQAAASASDAALPAADSPTTSVAPASVGPTASGPAVPDVAPTGTAVAADNGAGAATAAGPCSGLRASDQGVTPSEIFVAVSVLNVVGAVGNETVGVRGDMEEIVNAFVAEINAGGGMACRKLRVKVYRVNPLDRNDQRAKCLEILGAKPFTVVDVAGYQDPVGRQCFYDAKVPLQSAAALSHIEVTKASPYSYNFRNSSRSAAKNWVRHSAAAGTFDPARGFRELGVVVDECDPDAKNELMRNLTEVGVAADKVTVFTLRGCGSVAPPSDISQAVLQHRNAGVSHVFLGANPANSQTYVRQADGVRWKPTYLASDLGSVINSATEEDWPDGFEGAIGVTSSRTGERNSGIVHRLVTQCNDWLKKHGLRPSENERDVIPMVACDQLRLLQAAANGVGPNLVRSTLVNGLANVERFEAASFGDGIFGRPGKVLGGDFVRAVEWHGDCTCFKVLDRAMKPAH